MPLLVRIAEFAGAPSRVLHLILEKVTLGIGLSLQTMLPASLVRLQDLPADVTTGRQSSLLCDLPHVASVSYFGTLGFTGDRKAESFYYARPVSPYQRSRCPQSHHNLLVSAFGDRHHLALGLHRCLELILDAGQ